MLNFSFNMQSFLFDCIYLQQLNIIKKNTILNQI